MQVYRDPCNIYKVADDGSLVVYLLRATAYIGDKTNPNTVKMYRVVSSISEKELKESGQVWAEAVSKVQAQKRNLMRLELIKAFNTLEESKT
jgi:hypothetical protein